ncbi:hypothetical protein JCM3766R1_004719 [Sporobolomyces carnicolor]
MAVARPQTIELLTTGSSISGENQAQTGTELTPLKRPGFGLKGRPFPALVNAFEIKAPDITVHQYDVKIGPLDEKRPARLNRQVWRQLVQLVKPFGPIAVAYDGQALAFSPKELPGKRGMWEIDLPEADGSKGRRFTVTLQYARPIQLGALKRFVGGDSQFSISDVLNCIQALNIAVQHAPMIANPSTRSSFFIPPGRDGGASLSQGLEMWRGYYSSLRPGIGKVFINLDISSQVMYKPGNLANLLIEIGKSKDPRFNENSLNVRNIDPRYAIIAGRLIKNLKITLRCGDRTRNGLRLTRKIRELVLTSALSSTFTTSEGEASNVFEYFRKNYGVSLARPDWPVVRVSKTAVFPIELCEVDIGQKYGKPLSGQLTAELLRLTTVKPRDRLDMLRRGIEAINPRNDQAFGQWQTAITPVPLEVTARLLPPPIVSYQRSIMPREGAWNLGKDTKFLKPTTISRWMVFVFESEQRCPRSSVIQSVTALIQKMMALGLKIENAQPSIVHVPREVGPDDVERFFREVVKRQGGPPPQLLLCFLTTKPNPFYAPIKMFGDVVVGCATQCALISKAATGNAQYWTNVALKINVKMGGRNSSAPLGPAVSRPTIIFGADVYHAAPGSLNPSIAGLVSSTNREVTDYTSSISVQRSREELIVELDDMVYEHLNRFKQTAKVKPERLIFIRDGISEGAYPRALAFEVGAIRNACHRIDPEFKPALTFIIVGKKHHISIFPKNPRDGDRNGNVTAGTIVDTTITNPLTFDWYMQPHAALLGTGRPAHHTVLVDDSKFSPDVLQELMNNLSYSYARCTRAVSIPAPCYYANLLCDRAALLLGGGGGDDVENEASMSSGERDKTARKLLGEHRARAPKIHASQLSRLFFC